MGQNFPLQYDDYKRTVDQVRTLRRQRSLPVRRRRLIHAPWRPSQGEEDPRLQVMWAGYAFAKDFREERGRLRNSTTRCSPSANT